MEEKKSSLLALLRILEEFSDEDHILTQPELLNHLDNIYHLDIDRRTLYKNISILEDFGYDISSYADNGKGYFLKDRTFQAPQINLLCNAIHSSNLIPLKSSKELINQLLSTQSRYFKNEFNHTVFIDNKDKKENKEFFLNIEIIEDAIKQKKPIEFYYTKYNLKKEQVNRKETPYVISPHYMVYKYEKTYLIGKSEKYDDLTHFRIDKMRNIKIIDGKYCRLSKNEDPYEYAKDMIYMYNGDDYQVTIKCDNSILDDVIDIFGQNIKLKECDKDHFIAEFKSTEQGMIYIALQYIEHMEVLKPKTIRKEITDILKKNIKKYK